MEGLRPAGYDLKVGTPSGQLALLDEGFVPLELVNTIRAGRWAFRVCRDPRELKDLLRSI